MMSRISLSEIGKNGTTIDRRWNACVKLCMGSMEIGVEHVLLDHPLRVEE
jgi:hypothetical protein